MSVLSAYENYFTQFSLFEELLQSILIHSTLQLLFSNSTSKFPMLHSAKLKCTHVKMTPGEAEKGKCKNEEQILKKVIQTKQHLIYQSTTNL